MVVMSWRGFLVGTMSRRICSSFEEPHEERLDRVLNEPSWLIQKGMF